MRTDFPSSDALQRQLLAFTKPGAAHDHGRALWPNVDAGGLHAGAETARYLGDQTETDHASLVKAIKNGRVTAYEQRPNAMLSTLGEDEPSSTTLRRIGIMSALRWMAALDT